MQLITHAGLVESGGLETQWEESWKIAWFFHMMLESTVTSESRMLQGSLFHRNKQIIYFAFLVP